MNVNFKIEGMETLQAQLLKLGAEAGVKALAEAARIAFAPVLEAAKSMAPVKTGALRDSLRLTLKKPKNGELVIVVGLRIAGGKGVGEEADPARRWHFEEFGTAHMAAHPVLRPALEQNADIVLEERKNQSAKAIQRAIERGG